MKNKRFLTILTLIVVVVFSIAMLGGCETETPERVDNDSEASTTNGDSQDNSTPEEGEEEDEQEQEEQEEDTVFEIGEVVKMGDLHYAVNGIRFSVGSDFIKPDEGNKFLLIDISIKNIGSKFEGVSSLMMFKLVDEEGLSYDIALADTKGQVDGSIAPGRKLRGELAFEVPGDIENFELEINPDLLNNGLIIVNIPTSSAGQEYTGAFADDTTDNVEHYQVNDTVSLGDLDFTVNGVRVSSGSSFTKPEEGYQFVIVDITITNNGSESEAISSMMMFKIVNNEGISYDQSIMADTEGSLDGELGAGRKMKGEIAYEVPTNISKFELEITPDLINNNLIVFDIPVE